MTTIKIPATGLAVALLTLIACGDNKSASGVDARRDLPPADAQCSSCPAAPTTLGAQIDRMGRPAANTVLNKSFTTVGVDAAKDAYNANADPTTWVATQKDEFKKNLAILDALDTGLCGNGLCELGETAGTCALDCNATGTITTACGNQVLYNGGVGTTPSATSYELLASILANDELYLDTGKTTCAFYLAVEFGFATGAGNLTCGGRAPQYDVIDYSLSALAVGIAGFSTDGKFTPELGDATVAHEDYLSIFPYLGEPHTP